MEEKQFSATKVFRWKPYELINKNNDRRGKTFFSSNKNDKMRNSPDMFTRTDFHKNTRFLKDLVLQNTTSKNDQTSIKKRKASSIKRNVIIFQKSPYLSKSTEMQKMLRLLVPVKGPNQSLKLQIKRHNQLNIRNAQLLIIKKSEVFIDQMKAYSARMGLKEDTKIFMMNSRDMHIKNGLLNRGWVESGDKDSKLFHLKWVYKDRNEDYDHLQQGQLYNHFKNNQQLTNKNYLQKNIKKVALQQRPNYPLTFDIQSNEDKTSFEQSYFKYQQFRVFNVFFTHLEAKNRQKFMRWRKNSYFNEGDYRKSCVSQSSKNLQHFLYKKQIEVLRSNKDLWQSLMNLFELLCCLVEHICKQKSLTYCIFKSKTFVRDKMKFHQKLQLDLRSKLQQLMQPLSNFYLCQIFKIYRHLDSLIGNNYGFNNIWILKPAGVARGSGITITSDILKINQLKYGKILQKYIQHPLLLSCRRKFDIRQWILVKSFNPLKVYAYRKCYARFSSYKYSNENYENMNKHLTNYSQNKDYYIRQKHHYKEPFLKGQTQTNSVMQESQLQREITDWERVKHSIFLNILKTLQCCKTQVIQKQQSFQLYGFDIILDQQCKPYILEVNMSPACEKRQFLEQYLTQMAEGIVDLFQGSEPSNWLSINLQQYKQKQALQLLISQRLQKVVKLQRWWRKHLMRRQIVINNDI